MTKKSNKLSVREELFCHEYLVDLNPGDAYVRAGFSPNGRTRSAKEMLKVPVVKAKIEKLREKQLAKVDLQAEDVLRELLMIAQVDITEAFREDGSMKPLREIPLYVRRTIQSVEINELYDGTGDERVQIGFTKKVRFLDKIKALELLGKNMSLFKEVVEHKMGGDLAELMIEARERRLEREKAREERTVEAVIVEETEEPVAPLPEPEKAEELNLNPKRPHGFIEVARVEELNGCPKCFSEFTGKVCPNCNTEINRHVP